MKYEMVAIDMDGTLLNSKDEISPGNLQAIKDAMESGIKVVICTGRIFAAVKHYAKLLGVRAHVISCNGAVVCDATGEDIVFTQALEPVRAAQCIKIAKDNGIYYHFYSDNIIYTERLAYSSLAYSRLNSKLAPEDRIDIRYISDGVSFVEKSGKAVTKIIMIEDDMDKLQHVRRQVSMVPSVEISASMPNNFEVMAEGVSKGNALKMLAAHYGIQMQQVAAIGDSENDISMLTHVGLAVAMGNAIDEVKRAADYIVPSNDEDGVAYALRRYVMEDTCYAM